MAVDLHPGFRVQRKSGTWKDVAAPAVGAALADSHCHLGMLSACDLNLARAAAWGVDFICCITDPAEDAARVFAGLDGWLMSARDWAGRMPGGAGARLPRVTLACGCHPHNARHYDERLEAQLMERLADPRCTCLGEVGLDYHYDFSPRDVQRRVFRRQVRLAHQMGLVLALHVREAHPDALAILGEEGFPARTVLHCCTLGPRDLEPWLDAGCYVAFGGVLTFAKADDVRASAAIVPEDRLLLETDSPYMAPVPLRGSECGPEHLVFTAARLCEVRGAVEPDERERLLTRVRRTTVELLGGGEAAGEGAGCGAGASGASGASGGGRRP